MDFTATIAANQAIAKDTFLLRVSGVPGGAFEGFVPGQFAHVRVPHSPDLTLRRPFVVFDARKQAGEMEFVYCLVGEGTKRLTKAQAGEEIRVLVYFPYLFK